MMFTNVSQHRTATMSTRTRTAYSAVVGRVVDVDAVGSLPGPCSLLAELERRTRWDAWGNGIFANGPRRQR